jgi:hypothetical protein
MMLLLRGAQGGRTKLSGGLRRERAALRGRGVWAASTTWTPGMYVAIAEPWGHFRKLCIHGAERSPWAEAAGDALCFCFQHGIRGCSALCIATSVHAEANNMFKWCAQLLRCSSS